MTAPHALWLSLGLLGGPALLDPGLSDYRWNVTPRSAWGAQALAGLGPWGAGLRATRTRTTQTLGIPDPGSAARVDATTLEWVGQGRLASIAGVEMLASGSAGWLHLGYTPDHVDVPSGGGTPLTVELAPVNEWIAGAGLGARRAIAGPWVASVGVERRFFSMDTAHRSGTTIVMERERFGDWNARFELAWRWTRMKGTS